MNYAEHYGLLIERARNRTLDGYSERHHVIPRCLGGGNEKNNVVRLTPEEHYVAHLLLVKMRPDSKGLVWSAICMTSATAQTKRKNKAYGWVRRQFGRMISLTKTGVRRTDETRAKMSRSRLGKKRAPHSAETKEKMSSAAKNRPKSDAHRAALSAAKQGKPFAWSDEHRVAHRAAMVAFGAKRRATMNG